MDKELLEKLGIEVTEEMSEDDIKKAVSDKIDEKDQHITQLEDEKKKLSEDNEELTASVEGYKSSEEKLSKELEVTKNELTSTKGKLEQVTSMYKEQFNKSPNDMPSHEEKPNKDLAFDVMEALTEIRS